MKDLSHLLGVSERAWEVREAFSGGISGGWIAGSLQFLSSHLLFPLTFRISYNTLQL